MGFSPQLVSRALEQKRDSRDRALARFEKARAAAREKCPRIAELEAARARHGAEACKAALSGDEVAVARTRAESDRVSAELSSLKAEYSYPDRPDFSCPACRDTGYIDGRLCPCVETLARQLCYRDLSSRMPIERCRFDNFDLSYYDGASDGRPRAEAEKTLEICRNFVRDFPAGKNLLFYGAPGLGKTHLSLAVANGVLEKGYGVVYASAQNIFDAILKERYGGSGETDALDAVNGCDLLILDDLGTELHSSQTASVLFNIINNRLLSGSSTIISTNLTLDDLERLYEPRVVSRFAGDYTKRRFSGRDIRQAARLRSASGKGG